MKVLLDTHTLVWWLNASPKLSASARAAIADTDNEVFVSAATAWELATKARLGRWPEAVALANDFHLHLAIEGFQSIAITTDHGLRAGSLAGIHNDPFDRMLAAQAMTETMILVTIDPAIASLGAATIW